MTNRKKIAKRTKLALLLILGPTILIFGSILVLVTSNALGNATTDTLPASCNSTPTSESQALLAPSENCQNELFGEVSPTQTVINSVLFVVSSLSILLWLPCLIIGIILLVRRPRDPITEEPMRN